MDLLQNPFHTLAASPRDNRRRIMELADERSLLLDSGVCSKARSDLTTPRKRLSAEVSWLPGIGPKRARDLMLLLESSPEELLAVEKLPSIARANLLAAGLAHLSDLNSDDLAEWTLEIAWEFEDIEPDDLTAIINEERVVSGFPEVSDISAVEAEIQERRRHYRRVIKTALDTLPSSELVEAVTHVVESATDDGEEQGPILIADLVDSYEAEAQAFLDKEEANIVALVERLRAAVDEKKPDSALAPMVDQLVLTVKNWDAVAQPIQVSTKSRGLDHDASHRVAGLVRNLAVHMFNKHGKLDFSQQLTSMLQDVFLEVGKVAEQTEEDISTLQDLAAERKRMAEESRQEEEKWRKEITFEHTWGVLCFKSTVKISPEGVQWGNSRYPLKSITRIRWGGTRRIVNGMDRGTTYKVVFGDEKNLSFFTLGVDNFLVYSNFVSRLWRAIGTRMLVELFEKVGKGKSVFFGRTIVKDEGIVLERKKLFGKNELELVNWHGLKARDSQGMLELSSIQDKRYCAVFSYQEDDNIHVLSKAIQIMKNQDLYRMSEFFQKIGD